MRATVGTILDRKGRNVWSIAPDATVYAAIEQMAHHRIGALPVIEAGRLVGVVSERDYARRVILEGRSSRDTRVDQIMTTPVVTVEESCTIEEAMRVMTENRIRHLPVVDVGRLTGMISIGDLVRWIIDAQQEQILQLQSYISGSYPA